MASSYVGGLSGAFIPVSEDQRMIDAVEAGALTLEKLEAMTCVCSVGLDMIAIPGDTLKKPDRRLLFLSIKFLLKRHRIYWHIPTIVWDVRSRYVFEEF